MRFRRIHRGSRHGDAAAEAEAEAEAQRGNWRWNAVDQAEAPAGAGFGDEAPHGGGEVGRGGLAADQQMVVAVQTHEFSRRNGCGQLTTGGHGDAAVSPAVDHQGGRLHRVQPMADVQLGKGLKEAHRVAR